MISLQELDMLEVFILNLLCIIYNNGFHTKHFRNKFDTL